MAKAAQTYLSAPRWPVLVPALLPGLLIVAALCIYPLALAVAASLRGEAGVTFDRYVAFFTDRASYAPLLRTIGLALATTVVSVAISIPIAYAARTSRWLGTVIRLLVALPLAVPVLIAGYALTLFLSTNGLFNNVLVGLLGVLESPLVISYTWGGLIIACVWRFFPYTGLLVIAAITSMERNLEDAAASTGATPLQTFLRVTLPVIAPAALTGGVLTFVNTFGTFSIPLIMGGSRSSEVLSVVAYRKIAGEFDWPSASTIVIVMAVVQIVTLLVLRSAIERWAGRR